MHTIPLTERAEQTMQALPNSIHAFRLESKLTGGWQGIREYSLVPVESANEAYNVTTDEDTYEAIKPSPVLDNHPSLGWMLKNSSETIAYAIKVKKQDNPV